MRPKSLPQEFIQKNMTKVLSSLRKNTFYGDFTTYNTIMGNTRLSRSEVCKRLKRLEKYDFVEVEMINYKQNKGSRKKYRLNKKGLLLANTIPSKNLNWNELKIMHLYNLIKKSGNNNIL